jgi:hypothetical protein
MADLGFGHRADQSAKGKTKKARIIPILSIVLGIVALIWWVTSWLVVDSMSWGMCLAVVLPGIGGGILVLFGVAALIKQATAKDSEKE